MLSRGKTKEGLLQRPEIYCDWVHMGTLAFVILRENHIIAAADRRHTRGDATANYKNDAGFKMMSILSGYGVLGFAGHDIGEQILLPAKKEGTLDGSCLEKVSEKFGEWARNRYKQCEPDFATLIQAPVTEFLLTGFDTAEAGVTATAYHLHSPQFIPFYSRFPNRPFEVIGRSTHGALYALHRFSGQSRTIESDLALSAFVLSEIGECDTTIGGLPELHVIKKGEKAEKLSDEEGSRLKNWALETGENIGKVILKGPSSNKR
jgi:hypothetical protein